MRQLFRQNAQNGTMLRELGLTDVTVKTLRPEIDRRYVSQKTHHHTFFELHVIQKGAQRYSLPQREVLVKESMLLLFPPLCPHRLLETKERTEKLAICFSVLHESPLASSLALLSADALYLPVPTPMEQSLCALAAEAEKRPPFSALGVASHLLLSFLHLLRAAGVEDAQTTAADDADARLLDAKAFIRERVCLAPTVKEVAAHCHLCERQLNRLFLCEEGMTVSAFIRRERCLEIETLLSDSSLSLAEISERMRFSGEYAFNAFFKKHAGMPPGTFRRGMLK